MNEEIVKQDNTKSEFQVKLEGLLLKNEEWTIVDPESEVKSVNRVKVAEAARTFDAELLSVLRSDDTVKVHFFVDVEEGVVAFKLDEFLDFLSNSEFLPNSFTAYKNEIGLATSKRNFLGSSNDVVLNWPYKDCILEGGQSKDDQKRQERFYNQVLAPDEVSRLLDEKVFTNWTKYDSKHIDGEPVNKLEDTDNLILKGNNLVVLHSLKRRFAGKVKLIYIDPPYNTGSDSFGYNDRFNHSTWLTFMKNRLEVAKELLAEDGAIYANIDYNEIHYLKLLMDNIFGRDNFQREIVWRIGWLSGYKTIEKNYIRNHDTILYYSKSNNVNFNKRYIANSDFKPLIKEEKIKEEMDRLKLSEADRASLLNVINHSSRPEKYPMEDVWNGNEYDDLNSIAIVSFSGETVSKMLGGDDLKGQKSEKLLERIIYSHTQPGDIVLDFHLGSGTTAAVAHKMSRQYIGIEQMDYIEDITKARLKKVIDGEQGGISKSVEWQGGGSFVYAELANESRDFIKKIEVAKTDAELINLFETIAAEPYLKWQIDPEDLKLKQEGFGKLSIADKKGLLVELVNVNTLYVNYADINDVDYAISDSDKKLNAQFYKEVSE